MMNRAEKKKRDAERNAMRIKDGHYHIQRQRMRRVAGMTQEGRNLKMGTARKHRRLRLFMEWLGFGGK